ncbi:MAG TPA: ATP-binding protein [Myxococcota bacterium]|nr:ATP-binding protein [Myxococcota bacterium]
MVGGSAPVGTPQAPERDLTPALVHARDGRQPPAPPEGNFAVASLRRKMLWLSWLRIVTMLVLVTATAIFSGDTRTSFIELVQDTLMWVGLVGLIPSALYFPILLAIRSRRWLYVVAFIQLLQDGLFSSVMVAATGGSGSAFTFFFSLNIVVAGIVVGRLGTALSILLSFSMLLGISLMELGHLPVPSFLADVLVRSSLNAVTYSVGLNTVAFVSIGILSSYLAEQLRRSDIQRERYRATLEDLKQLHESILASVETGIVSCRMDNRILHVNRAAEALLGLDVQRVRGRHLFEILPELRVPMEQQQGGGTFEVRRGADGDEVWLRIAVSPWMSRVGEMIGRIVSAQDVTALKRMESRMKADERLATLGKLSAVVAHEIRNPLAAISASAQMLTMTSSLVEEDRKALDIVVRETDRLNGWITDLLDYARPRKGDIALVDLSVLLEQLAQLVSGFPAAEGMTVEADIEPGLQVWGDSHRLHRAFLNLAKNSLEAMSQGGQLVVRARRRWVDGRSWAVVRVIDNGWGIPAEELGRIFDAFYTTKPRGTGLGLATVVQVVEEAGGFVTVSSVPHVRTEFEVRLPLAHEASESRG